MADHNRPDGRHRRAATAPNDQASCAAPPDRAKPEDPRDDCGDGLHRMAATASTSTSWSAKPSAATPSRVLHVEKRCAGCSQRGRQIVHHLLRLCRDVTNPDGSAGGVQRARPGGEHQPGHAVGHRGVSHREPLRRGRELRVESADGQLAGLPTRPGRPSTTSGADPAGAGAEADRDGYFAAERADLPPGVVGVRSSLILAAFPVRSRR